MSKRKIFALNFISGFGGIITQLIVGLVSTPIGLKYWQVERYGLWALIMGVMVYLNASGLGINQAATTLITKHPLDGAKLKILKRSATLLFYAGIIGAITVMLTTIFVPNWIKFLGKIPEGLLGEAQRTCTVIAAFFFVNLIFSLVSSTLVGFQRAYIENIFGLLSVVLNFCGLLLIIYFIKGSLTTYAIVTGSVSFLLNITKTVITYLIVKKHISKIESTISHETALRDEESYSAIIHTAVRFFMIWVAATLVWNTDNFVVSNIIGLKDVTPYSVTFKLYYLIFNTIFVLNNALLPLMGKEYGLRNWAWISRYYSIFISLTALLGGLTFVGGVAFGQDFILLWTGKAGYAGLPTVVMLGLYSYLLTMVNLNSGLINAFNYTKGTPYLAFAEGFVKIGASIGLGSLLGLGGVAAGTALGSLFVPTWVLPLLLWRRSRNRLNYPLGPLIRHFLLSVIPIVGCAVIVQLFVNIPWIRIVLGIVLVTIYAVCSYAVIPIEVRRFIRERIGKVNPILSLRRS